MRDGNTCQFKPLDAFEVPPGHDGYTLGDEPCVQIEWSGLRAFAGFRLIGTHNRALVTLLFTDLVDSTVTANRLGDVAWRELLSMHYEAARAALERHHGREINTTGDGLLATFDAPAAALRCAAAIRRTATGEGLRVPVPVSTLEKSSSSGLMFAVSPCTKPRGSSVLRMQVRFSSQAPLARLPTIRGSCSATGVRTSSRAWKANGNSSALTKMRKRRRTDPLAGRDDGNQCPGSILAAGTGHRCTCPTRWDALGVRTRYALNLQAPMPARLLRMRQ